MNRISMITIFAALMLGACGQKVADDKHNQAQAANEGNELHKHGEMENLTHFTDRTELFVEFPKLVAGEKAAITAHFTRIADFKPVKEGTVTVILSGGQLPDERFTAKASSDPGIFRPELAPGKAGKRNLAIELATSEFTVLHDLGSLTVFANDKEADAGAEEEHHEEGIAFTKEQQWKVEFATSEAVKRPVQDAVSATGTLRPAAGAEAFVHAPAAGHILTRGHDFPAVGQRFKKGQVIAWLVPHLGADADFASLEMAAAKSRISVQQAKQDRERLEGLLADEAIAAKRVQEAKTLEAMSRSELLAAEERLAHYRRGTDIKGDRNSIPLTAPIDGELAEVMAATGSQLPEGAPIFRIVDARRLWLEVHVAESDLGRVGTPSGVSFRVQGAHRDFILDEKNSKLLAASAVIDTRSRTVPYTFELREPDPMLRVGMSVQSQIFGNTPRESVTVPINALQDENGISTVYVQTGGESFERRVVTIGTRARGLAEILAGLEAGERVVSKNPYLVRLAATKTESGGGHAGHNH
jgi:RND family efflux transporter MFP subunit